MGVRMTHAINSVLQKSQTGRYKHYGLVIGASSEIAKALVARMLEDSSLLVVVFSRNFSNEYHGLVDNYKQLTLVTCNYDESEIINISRELKSINLPCSYVFVCNGVLQQGNIKPEKKLAMFNADSFLEQIKINTVLPMLWIKNLVTVLKKSDHCRFVVLSARVGSISDNYLGGWYGYRSSKAALNMLVKTAAIEYGRSAKGVKFIAFHPGTTDSPLSKPFQSNLAKEKIFSPEFVAGQLFSILKDIEINNQASFLDWQGKSVEW